MKALVEQGMKDGAWGMSTGLIYTPGTYAKTDELIELAKIAAGHRGIYASHIRDEGTAAAGLHRRSPRHRQAGRFAGPHLAHESARPQGPGACPPMWSPWSSRPGPKGRSSPPTSIRTSPAAPRFRPW